MDRAKKILAKIGIREGNVLRFITSLTIPIVFFLFAYLSGNYFLETFWIINGILLGVILLVVTVVAGLAVVKSLFLVAGELSLLIFLAQSYCGVSQRVSEGDAALKSLLVLGLLYIAITFAGSLYKLSVEHYKKVEGQKWSIEKVIAVGLFIVLTVSFIWEIYLVVSPIILNLCVYR